MSNGNRVLLVEDNPDDVELVRLALRGFNLVIDVAETVGEARRMLDAYKVYRFVFLDLTLHGVDGTSLIRWTKDRYPWIQVVVLTGAVELSVQKCDELIDAGADRTFKKNLTSHHMRELMNNSDTNRANYVLGKPKRSWKTSTAAGLAAAAVLCGIIDPSMRQVCNQVALGLLCVGMTFSADSSVMGEFLKLFVPILQKKRD